MNYNRNLVEFRGIEIPQEEANILKEIENQRGKEFHLVSEINNFGPRRLEFAVKNKNIIEIGCPKYTLDSLSVSIGNLTSLKMLNYLVIS